VADERFGLHTERHPELGECVLDDVDQRKLYTRLAQERLGRRNVGAVGKEDGRGIDRCLLAEVGESPVHEAAEQGLRRVEATRHVHVLRAPAWQHEGDVRLLAQGNVREHALRVLRAQQGNGFGVVDCRKDAPLLEGPAGHEQRVSDVGEWRLGVRRQVLGETFALCVQGGPRLGG
jgi:hypothetical protein